MDIHKLVGKILKNIIIEDKTITFVFDDDSKYSYTHLHKLTFEIVGNDEDDVSGMIINKKIIDASHVGFEKWMFRYKIVLEDDSFEFMIGETKRM